MMAVSAALVPCAVTPLAPSLSTPQGRRAGLLRVRCQAQEKPQDPAPPVAPPPPPSAAAPEASTGLWEVLAFGGPGPERINGRLAMVGFVAALGVEAARGEGVAAQLAGGGGLAWFAVTAAVVTAASLVPLLRGVTAESASGRVMTPEAELWNGRLAMLGLVALAFTEYLKGGPLV
uniref:Early light-induced protein, chloroplastic n=1 Tax=Anthurium amnicola TaxID=1678845 RepID=A0A1D1XVP3_9ARAE